ncbi:MAG: HAMP domain-containing sensor histidine kinase [Myxococcota bacterium]
MRRGLLLLSICVPTVLLGVGWGSSFLRERGARESEATSRLSRSADAVRAAVDESLEELRSREDERPFYLYNRYYSPPDVLAISDPVALSPLAGESSDPRIVGYFQFDPDGSLRTPHDDDAEASTSRRAERIRTLLEEPGLPDLRVSLRGGMHPALVPQPANVEPEASPETELRWVPAPRADGERVDNAFAPQGPLTVSLNQWGQEVFDDLNRASQGDPLANVRVQQRGRSAPITRRRDVSPSESAPEPTPRPRGRWVRVPVERPAPAPTSPPVVAQVEAELDYTPMSFAVTPGAVVLHRVVSHEGTAVVQGVVLDREYLVGSWIPRLANQYSVDAVPDVTTSEGCAVRRPASGVLPEVGLCFSESALAQAAPPAALDPALQLGALLFLLAVVLAAAALIHLAARRAQLLSEQKSAFVSAVSHELRTPLTTLRMHSEMLRDGLVPEEKQKRFHTDMVQESVRLQHLVENVLELSRIEEGRRPFRPTQGDLRARVREIVEGQRPFLEARGFLLRVPEPGPPLMLLFDGQAVEQIVVNLTNNAAKYGRGEIAEISVEVDGGDSGASITVSDQGPGFDEDERERVFERFHRVEKESYAHTPGTGIGLSLVRELARAHAFGGRRGDAEVLPGPGGRVRVTIPAAPG